jgi:hypothetical protein
MFLSLINDKKAHRQHLLDLEWNIATIIITYSRNSSCLNVLLPHCYEHANI